MYKVILVFCLESQVKPKTKHIAVGGSIVLVSNGSFCTDMKSIAPTFISGVLVLTVTDVLVHSPVTGAGRRHTGAHWTDCTYLYPWCWTMTIPDLGYNCHDKMHLKSLHQTPVPIRTEDLAGLVTS